MSALEAGAFLHRNRHYLATLSTNGIVLLLGLTSGALAARLLGPSGRGELATIILWPTAFAYIIGSLGMLHSVTFFTAKYPQRRDAVFTAALSIGAIQTVVVGLAGYLFLPYLLQDQRVEVVRLSQFFLLFLPTVFSSLYLLNMLQGSMHLREYNLSRIAAALWYAVLLTTLYLLGRAHLRLIVGGQLAGYALVWMLHGYFVWRTLHPRLRWDRTIFQPMLAYGTKTQLGLAASYLNARLDQLVISLLLPPAALGFYAVAVAFSSPLQIVPQAMGIVTLPSVAQGNREAAHALIKKSLLVTTGLLGFGAVVYFFLVPYVLPAVFGQAFLPAVRACQVLVIAMIPLGLNQVLHESFRGLNRPLVPAYAEVLGNIVTAILLAILLPRYGFLGAAWASLGAYAVSFFLLFSLWRRSSGKPFLKTKSKGDEVSAVVSADGETRGGQP